MTNIDTDRRYAWWRLAIQGRAPEAILAEPECGFFWMGRGTARQPVAIFHDGHDVGVVTGFDRTPGTVDEIWPRCYSHPITDEVYWDTVDNRRWADLEGIVAPKPVEEAAAEPGGNLAIGSNQPPEPIDPLEEITDEVEAAIRQLDLVLPKPGEVVKIKAEADKIANSKDRLRELWQKADKQRVVEKTPHDEASKAVQARWRPLVEKDTGTIAAAAGRAEKALAAHLKWARDEQARIEREREAARQAEEKRLREEHEAAVAEARAAAEPEPEPPAPVEAPPPPEPVRVGGGLSGRRTGLRASNYRAVIGDYEKALEFFKDNAKVREVVQSLADALARSAAHTAAPGCTVTHDEGTT